MEDRIRAHALQNARKYGEARTGNVIPKIIGEFPEVKERMREVKQQIDAIVAEVNTLAPEKIRNELEQLAPDLLEKKQQKQRELKPLPNAVDGKVITRLPPEPSKYNHIGHALSFLINAHYAQTYHGKLILKFEDTNPEKVTQEFVDEMLADIKEYLGIIPDDIVYVSDSMDALLADAQKLTQQGAAYMCFCPREEMSKKRRTGEPCACREKDNHLQEWEQFTQGKYMNGECVLRFKGEMHAKNTVLRDPVLFRAVAHPHFRQETQYSVWPLYDFYSPITDARLGVTHVLRSNEFDLRVPLHEQIKELLGLPQQEIVHYGRFNITGATTKGREIRERIEAGEYIGWDDPRLVTLRALQRRGIQRETFYELVKQIGLSPYQVNLDFSMLATLNRKILDPVANRYSFVADPVPLTVADVQAHDATLHLHPDKKDGGRTLHSNGQYLIAKKDVYPGKVVRLMQDLTQKDGQQTEEQHEHIIHWLPAEGNIPVEVLMPDATITKGMAEHTIENLAAGDIVQFERFGFCRLDAVENGVYRFWYTHE